MASKPRPPTHLIGTHFGDLEILSLRHVEIAPTRWVYRALCRCICGVEKEVATGVLIAKRTVSCGCIKKRAPKLTGANSPQFKGYGEIRAHFWHGWTTGAKKREIPFEVTMEYAWNLFVSQGGKCALSGLPLVFGSGSLHSNTTASLDRLDNAKGYLEGNIQWVHKKVNIMRNALSIEEFVSLCQKISDHQLKSDSS